MESQLDGSRLSGQEFLQNYTQNYTMMLNKRDPVLRKTDGQESMSVKKRVADGTIQVD